MEIENFKGIRSAAASSLEELSVVTMSGRNGVGKSLIMEAIFLTWQGDTSAIAAPARRRSQPPGVPIPRTIVGPWGLSGSIELTLACSMSEWVRIIAFGSQIEAPVSMPPRKVRLALRFDKLENYSVETDDTEDDRPGQILLDPRFRDGNAFAQIDFLPAGRYLQMMDQTTLDANALSNAGAEAIRQSALQSVINRQALFNVPGVGSYLAGLDYASHLRQRKGFPVVGSDDFDAIAEGFRSATGKTIRRPELSGENQIAIFVEAGPGNTHSLGQLSSGEQEALGLMYVVRRLASQGGILLIDEPEQHLHPSLQRSLVSLVRSQGQYSQLWLSTHSPGLITATPTSSLLTMKRSSGEKANQLERLEDDPEKVELLSDLGVPPTLWQHGDYILVVEGSSDERLLTGLLPLEMGRALILVGESAEGVERTVEVLRGQSGVLPWLAIRDRDLMSLEEVSAVEERRPGLRVWPRRAIENLFLEESWIAATLAPVGVSMDESEIAQRLKEIARADRADVIRLLTERRVESRVKAAPSSRKDLGEWYRAQEEAARARREAVEGVAAEVVVEVERDWDSKWKEWVQGRRVLAEFVRSTPFRSRNHLEDAMAAAASVERSLVPAAVEEVRRRLQLLGV